MKSLRDILAGGTYRVLEALDRPVGRSQRGSAGRPSGVALIVALVTITVLSAAVTEYAYSSRVNLKMSVNAKDKVKSYFLARSAINLSHLLINFQYSLQNAASQAQGNKSANAGSCNPRMISIAMRRSNFQIYQYMDLLMRPFNSGSLETPVGGIDLMGAGVKGFGKVHGKFDVDIEPEAGKLNVNRFADVKIKQDDLQEFCALITDSQYSQVFRKQGNETPEELKPFRILRYIVDYIDLDQTELPLTQYCELEKSGGGSESARYDDLDREIEPRNAKLTHPAELYQVYGVSDAFMRAYGEDLTVYPVGKPNVNMADFPVFFSVLCRNTRLGQGANISKNTQGFTACQKSPKIAMQVMYFAMALDGVRNFFKDPISVLMAYVGSTQSRLLPSAKKGQPVAFLRSSQVHSFLEDFRNNPKLMAQFIQFSPAYRRLATHSRKFRVNRQSPNFPKWSISFDRTGIIRAVSTQTPSIYRIRATGSFGSTESTIESVVDFGKPIRRLPTTKQLKKAGASSQQMKKVKKALKKRRKTIPKGRVLYWRENVVGGAVEDDGETGPLDSESGAGFGEEGEPGEQSEEESRSGASQSEESSGFGDEGFGDEGFGGGNSPTGGGAGGGAGRGESNDWNFEFGN